MRIVLDTNVLVAAFIARGSCSELVEHCAIRHQITLSESILDEFRDILTRKLKYSTGEAAAAASLIRSRTIMVKPVRLPGAVCRDPDDDLILATALAGGAQVIITGDKDLTVLKTYKGIEIIQPTDFWKYEQTFFTRSDMPRGSRPRRS